MDPLNRLPHMMQDYVMDRVRAVEAEHTARKRAMKTRAEALAYIAVTQKKLHSIFGPYPQRTPLNARVTGGFERDGYRVEKVLFESRPDFPVTGNLYLPTGRESPAPCVLGVCGHSMNGKAYSAYQHFCQGLAMKGYVTFVFDPLGQGERLVYPDGKGGSRYGGSVLDHIQAGNQQSLVGDWIGRWRAWDGIRALDYLLSRPEADPNQVGLTGCSGGGTMTTWLLACERRFTMAAPSCFVTTWRRNLENELPADSEQDPPAALALGLDIDDFLAVHAPQPLILLTEEKDFFDVRGSEEVFARLRHLYRLLGHPDNVALYTGQGFHSYAIGQREAMYGWFNRATGKEREGSQEPALVAEPDETLWVTQSGQVAELKPKMVPAFTAEKSRALGAARKPLAPAALPKALARLLCLPRRSGVPDYRLMRSWGTREYPAIPVHYSVATAPGVQVAVTMLDHEHLGSRIPPGERAVLYLPDLSSDADLREEPLARRLARTAERFFAVDVRGTGESQPNTCGADVFLAPYGSDFFYAYWAMMLGETSLGWRVHDVLSVLDLIADRGYTRVHLAGRGRGCLPALFAALLDDRVAEVTLKHAPLSYAAIAEDESYVWPLSGMLPGVLRTLDLPDCYRALGAKLTMVAPVNTRNRPLSAAKAQQALADLGIKAQVGK